MGSQEAIAMPVDGLHKQARKSGPELHPVGKAVPAGKKPAFPKLKREVPYSLLDTKGNLLGIVEVFERNPVTGNVWVTYQDKKNHGRHQKLVYAHGSRKWFGGFEVKLCSGGACANDAHHRAETGPMVLERRRVHHSAQEAVRKMARKLQKRAEKKANSLIRQLLGLS